MRLLYDCCHNIAKKETITWDGRRIQACIHRKGATRALGPGGPPSSGEVPQDRPAVLVPGDMGEVVVYPR
jgi:tRNA-splicing ligase RtcB